MGKDTIIIIINLKTHSYENRNCIRKREFRRTN